MSRFGYLGLLFVKDLRDTFCSFWIIKIWCSVQYHLKLGAARQTYRG